MMHNFGFASSPRPNSIRVYGILCSNLVLALLPFGCNRQEPKPEGSAVVSADRPAPAQLDFPESLRSDDREVNELVQKAMNTCAARNYEAFRLLWNAREDPMSREEFEESWNAVKDIRIQALQRARLESDSFQAVSSQDRLPASPEGADTNKSAPRAPLVHVILAEVTLDPSHRAAERQPRREVVLMLVRENDQWRLARAPKSMRAWIRQKAHPPEPKAEIPKP